jgi:hypothetical protein
MTIWMRCSAPLTGLRRARQQFEGRHGLGPLPAVLCRSRPRRRADRRPEGRLPRLLGHPADRHQPLSDRIGRRGLAAWGLWLQAAALAFVALTRSFAWWLPASALLGGGTAMVYPTLIAAISDAAHPAMRARALSVYRLWRDLGYAVGALSSGVIADIFGFEAAILVIAALIFASGGIAAAQMRDRSR